jgi:hypothetical protein
MYDPDLMRPGCVLIQVAAGCEPGMAHAFPSELWLDEVTPAMRRFKITDQEQLTAVVAKTIGHQIHLIDQDLSEGRT